MVIGRPMYLWRNRRKGSQKIIARWRCGNEEEKNKLKEGGGQKMPYLQYGRRSDNTYMDARGGEDWSE